MNRLDLPGAFYCDALPDGRWAALFPGSHIKTNAGRVELPGEDVLFLRIFGYDDGTLGLTGQGHQTGAAWAGHHNTWASVGTTHGVSPCIFDQQGEVRVATPAQGSQGYRYVADDGQLVTGDDTYNEQTPLAQSFGLHQIWEWTHYGDVTIGQGNTGCLTISPFGRRMLELGDCRFVRFSRQGDQCSVSMVRPGVATLFWFHVSELATLPPEVITVPPDGPKPPDTPEPPMSCDPIPDTGQAAMRQLAVRPQINAWIRSQDDDERRKATRVMAEQLAFTLGPQWGTKDAGGGRPPSKDSVSRLIESGPSFCNYDYVNGTTRELVFGSGERIDDQHFIAVSPVNHLGTTQPPDVPPQPPSSLELRVKALEDEVGRLQRQRTADQARFELLWNDFQTLKNTVEHWPPPSTPQLPEDVVRESTHKTRVPVSLFGFSKTYDGTLVKK